MVRTGRNSNSSEILCMSSLPASLKRIRSKATERRWRYHIPHYKSMGAFCCHGHQSFDPICLKTLCSLSPPAVMLHIRGARWLSGRVSDSGARGRRFETYRRRVVSLSKTLYSPKVLVNYPGSGCSVPI